MISIQRHTRTELNLWVMPNAGFATQEALRPIIEDFETAYPTVRVVLTVHPWSLAWNRFMEVVKGRTGKTPPDVLQIGTTWLTTLSYLGALDPVPEWAQGSTGSEPGDALGDASPHAMPWFIDVRVLYYRRDILEWCGIVPSQLADWAGFQNACLEIQRRLPSDRRFQRVVAPLGFPGQKPDVLMPDLAPWVWQAGGDFCTADMREASVSQQGLTRGCEFYFDLIDSGCMPLPNSALPGGNFFTGRYAMQFSGSWPVDTYLSATHPQADPDVAANAGVLPLPAGPNGGFTFLGGSNLGVSSTSPNKDLAWEFIRFATHPGRLVRHARAIGALPPRLSGLREVLKDHPAAQKIFFESLGAARRLPRLIELGSLEQIIVKMSARLLSLIRGREYSHRRLQQEIASVNNEIRILLSIHRYGPPAAGRAA